MKCVKPSNIRAAVVGASGYGGAELARLLAFHPHAELAVATASGDRAGQLLSDLYPSLRGVCDIALEEFDVDRIAASCEVAFFALGHGKAFELVPPLLERGVKVIDLGADFRLRDAAEYKQWYKLEHGAPELLNEAVYGLPEWHREAIKGARLIANPGCYPTASSLALAPFAAAQVIEARSIIVDAASGTSGAGRASFGIGMHHPEVHDDFKAYNVGAHRHTPEIEQMLGDARTLGNASSVVFDPTPISFTAHLLPIVRGILATCYAQTTLKTTGEALDILRARYDAEPFVRVHPAGSLPQIKHVASSNFCDIGAVVDERTGRLIVVSAIDNLIKGAAGQAVQNMNIVFNFEESAGLNFAPVFP
jgi:N-acetyl-gamma-glutamyl-phosphate reductase